MNYGYKPTKWDAELALALVRMLHAGGFVKETCGAGYTPGREPYVEAGGLYQGVRIRRITNLSGGEQERLVTAADEAYRAVEENRAVRLEYAVEQANEVRKEERERSSPEAWTTGKRSSSP